MAISESRNSPFRWPFRTEWEDKELFIKDAAGTLIYPHEMVELLNRCMPSETQPIAPAGYSCVMNGCWLAKHGRGEECKYDCAKLSSPGDKRDAGAILKGAGGELYTLDKDGWPVPHSPNEDAINEASWKLLECAGPEPIHFNRLKDIARAVIATYLASVARQDNPPKFTTSHDGYKLPRQVHEFLLTVAGPAFNREDLRIEASLMLKGQANSSDRGSNP
jgi:hypothetical protein